MASRYDHFNDSVVLDTDGQLWPDPLFNYNNGKLSKIPTELKITTRSLTRFWTTMFEEYGLVEKDDQLLNINGVKYLMDLKPGDIIYKVDINDLDNYFTDKQIGEEDS